MFSLTDPDRLRALLAAGGFAAVDVRRIEVPGKWGADAADAAAFLLDSGPGRHLLDLVCPPVDLSRPAPVIQARPAIEDTAAQRWCGRHGPQRPPT